jgi:hypothetical protein
MTKVELQKVLDWTYDKLGHGGGAPVALVSVHEASRDVGSDHIRHGGGYLRGEFPAIGATFGMQSPTSGG